jgi:predicted enzyme related to lactoylglutathione lyase
MTNITEVATVAVPVTDQDRALEFYLGHLGLEKRLDAPLGPGLRWIEIAPPGGATSIALVAADEDTPSGIDTGIRLKTTDADADHRALQAAGVDVDADIMRWEDVPPMFTLRDPDGNRLVIVERPGL